MSSLEWPGARRRVTQGTGGGTGTFRDNIPSIPPVIKGVDEDHFSSQERGRRSPVDTCGLSVA